MSVSCRMRPAYTRRCSAAGTLVAAATLSLTWEAPEKKRPEEEEEEEEDDDDDEGEQEEEEKRRRPRRTRRRTKNKKKKKKEEERRRRTRRTKKKKNEEQEEEQASKDNGTRLDHEQGTTDGDWLHCQWLVAVKLHLLVTHPLSPSLSLPLSSFFVLFFLCSFVFLSFADLGDGGVGGDVDGQRGAAGCQLHLHLQLRHGCLGAPDADDALGALANAPF